MANTNKNSVLEEAVAEIKAVCDKYDVCLSADRDGDMTLSIRDGKHVNEMSINPINGDT